MVEKRGILRLPINGEEISVPSALHLRCPKCGEIVLRFQDAKRLHEDAIAIYRNQHGLLSADEIRAIRERFNLTQADLARLLRLGANTVSRWESGRNVQTAAMDMLLRLIRDLPGSLDYLRDRAGPPLGSRMRQRFARIGLDEDIRKVHGQKPRSAVFEK
jgi:putative zinc finger/helix-turn-helix YgiT family protein